MRAILVTMVCGVLLARVSAAAVVHRPGDSGPFIVLLTHGGDAKQAEADVEAATRTLEHSVFAFARQQVVTRTLPPDTCERVEKNTLVPFLRCSAKLNEVLATAAVPDPKVVVLSRLDFTSRGEVAVPTATSGAFVSTARPGWTQDLLHELAHTFGLRDERPVLATPAKGLAATPGPNCAATRAEAERRWGDLAKSGKAGFYAGCAGHRDWLRPDERTIMDSPRTSSSFGATSERYLKTALRCCFTANGEGCAEAVRRDPELSACAPAP